MPQNRDMDFSTLFKLDQLAQLDVANFSFYEVGLKKFLALCSDKELLLLFISADLQKNEKNYFWDFNDNPIYCMCFEPSGTWVVIISEQKVLLVPFLPLFAPESTFDCKWSLSGVTVLPLVNVPNPCSVVWWLTKESENIIIIGSKNGGVSFFSMETQSVIADCKVSDEINDLQICFDDSLDLLTLLITGVKSQHWKLVLEHRSYGYNLIQQLRNQSDSKKDSFMSYIKQFSKDKITIFSHGSSKEDNSRPQTVEYSLKPAEYYPSFWMKSSFWSLQAQYVSGRHFLTAFDISKGHIYIASPEQEIATCQLGPSIKHDFNYTQGLYSQRLLYLLGKNGVEIHSSTFSALGSSRTSREHSLLWSAELSGVFRHAYLMSAKEPQNHAAGWKLPTFLCDLQLPRFALEPCLIITSTGAYLLSTKNDPSEWLVGVIMSGGSAVERAAAALHAPVKELLLASADMLLSRGKLAPAQCLYSLSQCQPNGWLARLGVFGRLQELSLYKQPSGSEAMLSNTAVTIKLYAILLKVANSKEEKFDTQETKFTSLSVLELEDLTAIASSLGLWDLLPIFNIHRGHPSLLLSGMRHKGTMCRGALDFLLRQRSVVTMILNPSVDNENKQWFLDFIDDNYLKFDTKILKCLCLWLCPLQDQLRPVLRDMRNKITTTYTPQMTQLISTFMRIASALESHNPSPNIIMSPSTDVWKQTFVPRRQVSCGFAHWAVCEDGNAKIMVANTEVDTNLIGRVASVSCGRHHTLVLTENGLYTCGDNTYGQLGVGSWWYGAVGDAADASGSLTLVPHQWGSPLTVVAAGHYHSAAVDLGGRLYMWGWGVHGQLGLGTIDDEWSPKLVTKLQGRKVVDVGCGSCHTVVLTIDGTVFAFGASVFGQLGSGDRNKCTVPRKVALPAPARAIATNYFHTLALLSSGALYTWGGSPQSVRAHSARRAEQSPPSPSPSPSPAAPSSLPAPARDHDDAHLTPRCVAGQVPGRIVQISAGWHHSAIVNNAGTLYTWGLNFDGQLGSGDKKLVVVPTEAKFNHEIPTDAENTDAPTTTQTQEIDLDIAESKALVACGADFTVYIDEDGKIYISGNTHQEGCSKDMNKVTNRVIMMKTTKRVIKIPSQKHNKFIFKPIDRLDIMFPFDVDSCNRTTIEPKLNPLNTLQDFKKTSWSDEIITSLLPWITESSVSCNKNMAAKLAFHSQRYDDCLRLLLQNLRTERPNDVFYLIHTEEHDDSKPSKKDSSKIAISNIMSERIKEISLSILNEQPYPILDPNICKSLPCCCDETQYLPFVSAPKEMRTENIDLSVRAADIVDKCIGMFPVEPNLWETCFRISKDFYIENDLCVAELEKVLRKYMELNARTMAAAIMYSNDCVQYSKILSPKLYLNMCSQIMDAWN